MIKSRIIHGNNVNNHMHLYTQNESLLYFTGNNQRLGSAFDAV